MPPLNDSRAPLVSVITPAYNAARFLRDTIRSVQAQTFTDWEMIIIDDCSTDETWRIVADEAKGDPRIRPIMMERNSKQAAARNAGLKVARGRYVAFLDSDDLWLPEKLELQVKFMQEKDVAFSYTYYRPVSEDLFVAGWIIKAPQKMDYNKILRGNRIGCLTVLLDREKIGPFSFPLVLAEDYALWLTILRGKLTACCLSEDLARYRVVRSSFSSNKIRSSRFPWSIYRNFLHEGVCFSAWCFFNYSLKSTAKHCGIRLSMFLNRVQGAK